MARRPARTRAGWRRYELDTRGLKQEIPNKDHVIRHCRARNVHDDEVSGKEFELRLTGNRPEEYLSVNWMERTGEVGIDAQLQAIRAAIPRNLKPRDRLARLNVGRAKQRVFQNASRVILKIQNIGTTHPTYSGIFNIPKIERINKAVGLQLAMVVSGDLYPATEL